MSVCFAFLAWIGMFSAGFCNELWQLYITQGTIAAIGQGAGVTLCVSAPAQWFKKVSSVKVPCDGLFWPDATLQNRALAIGVALSGFGLGMSFFSVLVLQLRTDIPNSVGAAVFSLLVPALIDRIGVKHTLK
jgi:hypothetical protein